MSSSTLRFGVLGVGRIGKIHAENLVNRIPGAELAALSDALPAPLAAMAKNIKITRTFTDYRDLLALKEIDAIVICTPTSTHYQIILDAAAAGKHIFCEKPLDLSLERLTAIEKAIQQHGVQLMVGFNRRYDANFLKLRESVAQGKIGAPHILRITSRDPAPPPEDYIRLSGGIFMDMTIHDFDMARYLFGSEIEEVYAATNVLVDPVFRKLNDWDTAIVTLKFANGAIGAIDNSRQAVYGYDQRIEVFGSQGMIAVSNNLQDNHVHLDKQGSHSALPLNFFMDRYTGSYLREMEAFVDSIRNHTPSPVSAHDGRMAVVIGMAASLSAREDRPVRLTEIQEKGA
jgi:myo-inositol 2-dehydrogenase / D-chiro-inositol 1-dehydrogenase